MSATVYRDLAREKKATAIAQQIWRGLSDADRRNPLTVKALELAPQHLRDGFARAAGQNKPSDDSWTMVVEKVEALIEDEMKRVSFREAGERLRAEMAGAVRVCLQCFVELECEPWPAPAPLYCEDCEATRSLAKVS